MTFFVFEVVVFLQRGCIAEKVLVRFDPQTRWEHIWSECCCAATSVLDV